MQESAPQVIIASNPKSGSSSSRERVSQLCVAIADRGFGCKVLNDLTQVRQQVLELLSQNMLKAVVSAGGDGTAEALANLLPAETPLLPFPLGTENLLAKHFGISGDVRQACRAIEDGTRLLIDVGSANGKIFLVMLSCGFDADVVRAMAAIRKGHISRWSYFRPILSTLRSYRFPQLPFFVDGNQAASQSAAWIFVFNLPRYAAHLALCPQADPLDGYLDICTFRRGGVLPGLAYLAGVIHGSHHLMQGVTHQRCRQVSIEAPLIANGQPHPDIPYQQDGDPGGVLPLSIEILPRRLTLLRPNVG